MSLGLGVLQPPALKALSLSPMRGSYEHRARLRDCYYYLLKNPKKLNNPYIALILNNIDFFWGGLKQNVV